MKSSKAIIIAVLSIALMLFLAGQFAYKYFLHFAEPSIEGISFDITNGSGVINTSWLFSSVLFLIPILIYVVWKLAPIHSPRRRIASILIVLLFVSIAIFVRHQEVRTYFTRVVLPALLTNGKTNINYSIDPVNFVYYLFGGLIFGWLLSWMLLKQKSGDIKE